MAGTAQGAQRARERQAAKRAQQAQQSQANEAMRSDAQPSQAQPSEQPSQADGYPDDHASEQPSDLMTVENNSRVSPQQVAGNVGLSALPAAMQTVVTIMRSTRAPAAVRLNAATWLLETGGIGPAKATAGGAAPRDASEMDRHDLQAFVAAGLRALSMRRSAAGASDASVIDVTPRALPTT